jgi:hypothetical protein
MLNETDGDLDTEIELFYLHLTLFFVGQLWVLLLGSCLYYKYNKGK